MMNTDIQHILVVEDEPAHAEAISRILENSLTPGPVRVTVVSTLEAYRHQISIHSPDIAVIDLNLPDGNAIEILQSPPESGPFPILMMTSYGNERIAVEAVKSGALDYIVKSPESFRSLPDTIRLALREWHLIKDRHEAIRTLQESEARFRNLVTASPYLIFVLQNARYVYVNPAALKQLGYTENELLDRHALDLIPSAYHQIMAERIKNADSGQPNPPIEMDFEKKDGTFITVQSVSVPITYSGKPAILITSQDITRRKRAKDALRESERFLQSTLDSLAAHITLLDEHGTILLVNRAWREFADGNGIPSDKVSEGVNYLAVCDGSSGEYMAEARPFADGIRAVLSGTTTSFVLEYPCHSPVEERWFLGRVTPFTGDGPRRVVVAHENITERVRMEKEQLDMKQRLFNAEKAKSLGRMAGAVAHHFNNLLGVVIGNLEFALIDFPSESTARECIDESMKSARRAAGISKLMLAYLGQTMKIKEPLDLSRNIRQILDINRVLVPWNIDLKTGRMDDAAIVLGNTEHLKQIVTNLITNSVEAIGEATGHITISAEVVDPINISQSNLSPIDWKPKASAYMCLSVADTGPGLDPATHEKIFDPFFTTKFTGRGMGLPVVIGLMQFHEGAVAVESRPGEGTLFRLYFPILDGTAPVSEKKQCSASPAKSSGAVLLVEDEASIRNMTRIMLERLGHEVMTACDGIEAVEQFTSNTDRIKCVLLDLSMPRMGGLETMAALREIRPDLPIILTSGYMDAPEMAAKQGHIPAFLTKPYGKKDLEIMLTQVLASPRNIR